MGFGQGYYLTTFSILDRKKSHPKNENSKRMCSSGKVNDRRAEDRKDPQFRYGLAGDPHTRTNEQSTRLYAVTAKVSKLN